LEERQRAYRRERAEKGENWVPFYFEWISEEDEAGSSKKLSKSKGSIQELGYWHVKADAKLPYSLK
jgi:hypothetical protein